MNSAIKILETLGAGEELSSEQNEFLCEELKTILITKNSAAFAAFVNAPEKIICGVVPAEDDETEEVPSKDKKTHQESIFEQSLFA